MALRIRADKVAAPKFRKNLAGLHDRMQAAITAAANMAASLIKTQGDADIKAAGNFGERWTAGLHVDVEGTLGRMKISMTHDMDEAKVFEKGGKIQGDPLLWIPLSGTDAVGKSASEYGDKLFSAKSRRGTPLLFSMEDKLPKYFGIESVTMPKKFHLAEVQKSVMANFRQIFDAAWRQSARG